MFDKIIQQAAEKLLPVLIQAKKIHRTSMLVNAASNIMGKGTGIYTAAGALDQAKQIIEIMEAE